MGSLVWAGWHLASLEFGDSAFRSGAAICLQMVLWPPCQLSPGGCDPRRRESNGSRLCAHVCTHVCVCAHLSNLCLQPLSDSMSWEWGVCRETCPPWTLLPLREGEGPSVPLLLAVETQGLWSQRTFPKASPGPLPHQTFLSAMEARGWCWAGEVATSSCRGIITRGVTKS